MIEVVSYPTDLSTWDPTVAALQGEGVSKVSKEFYLELYGETTPVVDMDYAQVLPAGNPDGTPQTAQAAPIYEYWWTVGHGGFSEHREHFWDHLGAQAQDHDIWHDLNDETAARVYVFFPIDAGWRVKELISTVKYRLMPSFGDIQTTRFLRSLKAKMLVHPAVDYCPEHGL